MGAPQSEKASMWLWRMTFRCLASRLPLAAGGRFPDRWAAVVANHAVSVVISNLTG
ncbi:MAG: hypothetical protein JWM76_4943 [Pseudonocardiales bacterium]|nr:hypothetical protein [Pseudonocardiales bacterium]